MRVLNLKIYVKIYTVFNVKIDVEICIVFNVKIIMFDLSNIIFNSVAGWRSKSSIIHTGNHLLNLLHTENYFRNLIKSDRNQTVFTIFKLIWHKMAFRLIPNRSGNGKYNLIWVWFNNIPKRFLCVCLCNNPRGSKIKWKTFST